MKVSPFCKRFKHSYFTGDTFTLPDVRSSIIRNLQRCNQQQNTVNLWRLKKQTQNREIWIQKTDRLFSVSERTLLAQPITEHQHSQIPVSVFQVNGTKTKMHNHDNYAVVVEKTYLIIEMIPHMVYYSYATKYYNLTLMNSFSYLCSYVYINVEMWLLMKRYIQRWIHIDTQERKAWRGLPSWAFSWVFGEFLKFKSSSAILKKQSDFLRVKHAN